MSGTADELPCGLGAGAGNEPAAGKNRSYFDWLPAPEDIDSYKQVRKGAPAVNGIYRKPSTSMRSAPMFLAPEIRIVLPSGEMPRPWPR